MDGEAGNKVLQVWRKYYECDPLYDQSSDHSEGRPRDCPPIKRMLAVHGVNVPTPIKFALKMRTARRNPHVVESRFELDDQAVEAKSGNGYRMKGGIWYEEKGGDAPSGDGTVPFQSLEHSMSWKKHLRLRCERLDGVGHREMLADASFHQ